MRKDRHQMKFECRLIPTEDLLAVTVEGPRHPTMKLIVGAFHQWNARVLKSKPGDGSLCLTCDVEFGPDRVVPAAFWFQSPIEAPSRAVIVSGLCPVCFARADCQDRILAGMRQRLPDLQVMPTTRQ